MKKYLSNFHGEKTKGSKLFRKFEEIENVGNVRKILIPIMCI